jgi:hypothetical protein
LFALQIGGLITALHAQTFFRLSVGARFWQVQI